jgi:drug/metabolite transporter (DMT)-like permease
MSDAAAAAGRRAPSSKRTAAELALAVNTIVWGATFVLVKTALDDVSPILFLALRFTLAAVVLAVVFRNSWRAPAAGRQIAVGALVGVFLFTGYLFQTLGLRHTTAPKSAFITGLTSVMVPLLAACVYRIRPQVSEVVGVLVATAGLGLLTLGNAGATPVQGSWLSVNVGDLLTFACTLGFAAQVVTLGHYSGQMSFALLSVSQVSMAALLSWSLLWIEPYRLVWRPAVVCAILVTGLLCTALAFSIQAWAQQHTTSTRTAVIYMIEPVVAWLTSYVLVGEGLSARAAAGAALILGGVLMVEVKPWGSRPHPSSQGI